MQKGQVWLKILDIRLRGYDPVSRPDRHTREGGYPVRRLLPAPSGFLHNQVLKFICSRFRNLAYVPLKIDIIDCTPSGMIPAAIWDGFVFPKGHPRLLSQ